MGAPQNHPSYNSFPRENSKKFACISRETPQTSAEFSKNFSEEIFEKGFSTSESSPTNENSQKRRESATFAEKLEETSHNKQAESLLIDVKPKRKIFQSEEEKKKYIDGFVQKKKTELCKNWEMKGSCKYGENCSFAHGLHELKTKTHLNSNYKQKPCKQFLIKGVCSYGNRCQYLHREIKYYPEHKDFLLKVQKKTGLSIKSLVNFKSEVKELRKMETEYEKIRDVEKLLCANRNESKRLPIFSLITRL